jgi:hypothetical protein
MKYRCMGSCARAGLYNQDRDGPLSPQILLQRLVANESSVLPIQVGASDLKFNCESTDPAPVEFLNELEKVSGMKE